VRNEEDAEKQDDMLLSAFIHKLKKKKMIASGSKDLAEGQLDDEVQHQEALDNFDEKGTEALDNFNEQGTKSPNKLKEEGTGAPDELKEQGTETPDEVNE